MRYLNIRWLMPAAAGLLLAGCTTTSNFVADKILERGLDPAVKPISGYPEYKESPSPSDVQTLLGAVRKEYESRETDATRLGANSLVPLAIGATAAVATIAFIKGPAQITALKGIGIGTGLVSLLTQRRTRPPRRRRH
jgi:hypothetical protein